MAWKDLESFLVDLSANPQMKKQLRSDPDAVLKGYNLTATEKKLIRAKDGAGIKKYLADKYTAALQVNVS